MANLWISRQTLDSMEQLAEVTFPNETGGMLLGYESPGGDVVITAIIGPGPAAKHMRYAFEPDAEYQQSKLNMHYRRTNGRESYLGDWHTHPNGQCILSRVDKKTLACIAQTPSSRINHPVMVILGGKKSEWQVATVRFQSMKRRLVFSSYCLEILTFVVFQTPL